MVKGQTYTAVYEKGLDYFGKKLTVQVDVKLDDPSLTAGFTKIYIDADGLVKVQWRKAFDAHVDWKITILDPDTKAEYPFNVFIGFMDPDESNLMFDTTPIKLYYNSAGKDAAGAFVVENDGLYRAYKSGDSYIKYDTKSRNNVPTFRNDGQFFVTEENPWSSFSFTTVTFENGALMVPFFYSYAYSVDFDPNRPDGATGDGTMTKQSGLKFYEENTLNKNEFTTVGYTFLGWNTKADGSGIDFDDQAKFTDSTIKGGTPVVPGETVMLYAKWAPYYNVDFDANRPEGATGEGTMEIQKEIAFGKNETLNKNTFTTVNYEFVGWNTAKDGSGIAFTDEQSFTDSTIKGGEAVKPAETVVLYAQWRPIYNVAFDANRPEGTTGEGTMDPQEKIPFDKDDTLTKNAFTTEGYTFVGWNTAKDGTGTTFTDGQKFNDNTIKPDGTVAPGETVTLYGMWELNKYWINYDPNGGKDPVDMPRQEFDYFDPEMKSNPNKFTRDGYNFLGFLYTDKEGNSKLYKDVYDFVDILKALGPNSEITLVAQWEKKPEPITVNTSYALPKTGIE
jgi:hypothetical protein